jgi:cytochrome c oxidase subunit 2
MEQLLGKLLGLPVLASEHGAEVDKFIIYIHYLMIVLFVGWSGYLIYTLWRFRKSRNPKADYVGVTSHASSYLELAVVAVEVVLLVGFAVPLWARVADKFPSEKESVMMRVTGQQFAWSARYAGADGKFGKQDISLVSSANPLGLYQLDDKRKAEDLEGKDDISLAANADIAIPLNKDVIVSVTSLDVIHSFKVPAFRMTQDAIPGLRLPVHFKATKTNTYQINCAQLCGIGHSNMKGIIKVLPQADFDVWLKSKVGAAPVNFE